MPLSNIIAVGGLQTNCYIIASPDPAKPDDPGICAVIDPGGEPSLVIHAVKSAGFNLRYILCTHGHPDHTGGVARLHDELGGRFYLAAADTTYSNNPPEWLLAALDGFESPPAPDPALEGVSSLEFGSAEITFMRTPGHTPGSTCFFFEGMIFTGDTLFKGSIGRYDLPGGDGAQEIESIRNHLLTLPDDTAVFPGHGPSSTIGQERQTNPYLA